MIASVPPEIGKLKRIRKIILNSNRIKYLPAEVGRLEMLEELIVSENALEELPSTIATMAMLRVLKIQNNNLKTIPYELIDVVTLEELDVSLNPQLTMIPKLWQGDTNSVLFVCRVHRGSVTFSLLLKINAHRISMANGRNYELKYRLDQTFPILGAGATSS